eukprot:1910517-Amphidinium_carterae.1
MHYRERVQNIFLRAKATVGEYNQAVEYFDSRGGAHFTRPNRRDLEEIRRTPQTAEERKRSLDYIRQAPEMQRLPMTDQPSVMKKTTSRTMTTLQRLRIREHQEAQA